MKIYVILLDDDGYEAYREEYNDVDDVPDKYRDVVHDMVRNEEKIRSFGDIIIEVM